MKKIAIALFCLLPFLASAEESCLDLSGEYRAQTSMGAEEIKFTQTGCVELVMVNTRYLNLGFDGVPEKVVRTETYREEGEYSDDGKILRLSSFSEEIFVRTEIHLEAPGYKKYQHGYKFEGANLVRIFTGTDRPREITVFQRK